MASRYSKDNKITKWNEKTLHALIEAVKRNPVLYKNELDLISEDVKNNCWEMIGAELQICEKQCRRKWNMLRNEYIRARLLLKSKQRNVLPLRFLDGIEDDLNTDKPLTNIDRAKKRKSDIEGNSTAIVDDDICVAEVNLLSSDDDEVLELYEKSPSQLTSSGLIEKQQSLVYSVENLPSSSSSSKPETILSSQEHRNEIVEPISTISIQNPSTEVLESNLHSNDDTLNHSSGAKRLKLNSSTNINTSNEDVVFSPVLTSEPETATKESQDEMRTFFSDLSSYIKNIFSKEKQKDLQSKIYSLLMSEELKRHQPN